MLAKFRSKKKAILNALGRPAEDYEDLSPKGNLDEEIRRLVEEINSLPGYVTTSSCAGRVAVYLEGEAKAKAITATEDEQTAAATSNEGISSTSGGGKGGGRWLFVSHQPINLDQLAQPGTLFAKLGFSRTAQIAFPPAAGGGRFVHLKFEPMILHVLAQSAEDAQTMLGAGMAAGFRESGISGVVDSKGRPSMPMVAIRSSGLAMDCIIGFQSGADPTSQTTQLRPMVSEEYLRTVIAVSNQRFRQNIERKERFQQNLLTQMAGSITSVDDRRSDFRRRGGFQSASDRKAEKRAEDMRKREAALERRAQALHRGGALDGTEDERHVEDDDADLAFDVLLYEGKNSAR